jgi:hypothetical protein
MLSIHAADKNLNSLQKTKRKNLENVNFLPIVAIATILKTCEKNFPIHLKF